MPVSLAAIEDARLRLVGTALRTPLVRLNVLDTPAEIYLKLENLQPIGSFKIRGAANAMAQLSPAQLQRGVLTASAGNMAQGVAWRARELGIPCTVVAPDTAPETKLDAITRLGGRVIKVPFERWWQTFQDRAYPGVDATFIHAFDDPHVMAGNGVIGLEILEDLPDVDTVGAGWSAGSRRRYERRSRYANSTRRKSPPRRPWRRRWRRAPLRSWNIKLRSLTELAVRRFFPRCSRVRGN
jgi:threonine dehydratase